MGILQNPNPERVISCTEDEAVIGKEACTAPGGNGAGFFGVGDIRSCLKK